MPKLLKVLDSVLYKESYSSTIEAYPVTKKMGIASYQVNTSSPRVESIMYQMMKSFICNFILVQTLCYVRKISQANFKFFSHSASEICVNSLNGLF